MKKQSDTAQLERRYTRLTQRLARLGPVLQGTITQRTIVRPDPQTPREEKSYGPYYQWTFKRSGKTVTVNLTAAQAKTYQGAIDNHRTWKPSLRKCASYHWKSSKQKPPGVRKRKTAP